MTIGFVEHHHTAANLKLAGRLRAIIEQAKGPNWHHQPPITSDIHRLTPRVILLEPAAPYYKQHLLEERASQHALSEASAHVIDIEAAEQNDNSQAVGAPDLCRLQHPCAAAVAPSAPPASQACQQVQIVHITMQQLQRTRRSVGTRVHFSSRCKSCILSQWY